MLQRQHRNQSQAEETENEAPETAVWTEAKVSPCDLKAFNSKILHIKGPLWMLLYCP